MARPLRIQRPNGRYHITARGNERKAIYRDQRDREHFLELLAEMTGKGEGSEKGRASTSILHLQ